MGRRPRQSDHAGKDDPVTINSLHAGLAALAVSIVCVSTTSAHGQAAPDELRASLDLERATVQPVHVPAEPRAADGAVRVQLELDGRPVELTLLPASVRGDRFRVRTTDGAGRLVEQPAPPAQTYRGTVAQMPGSLVAASISDGSMRAYIRNADAVWAVQPARDVNPRADAAVHVVYRHDDRTPLPVTCATDAVAPMHDIDPPSGQPRSGAGDCAAVAEIAFDADREFFLLNNSSVADTVADIESIVNAMNLIYERDVQITHIISEIIIRTAEPDGYDTNDSFLMLGEMQTKWNAEHAPTGADPVHRDVAHLMTGKDLSGNIIGRAFVSALCTDPNYGYGYGLSQSHFSTNFMNRVGVTAHEVGHNWSASHCNGDSDCAIMCSSIGSCGPVDVFGSTAIDSIIAYRDTRTCVDAGGPINDCNDNCIDDALEIASGDAHDCNGNGVPDSCESTQQTCPADLTGDELVNVLDLLELLSAWGACDGGPCGCPADMSSDGMIDVFDLLAVLDQWGSCP